MENLEKIKGFLDFIKSNKDNEELVNDTTKQIINEITLSTEHRLKLEKDLKEKNKEICELKDVVKSSQLKIKELEEQVLVCPNIQEESNKLDLDEIKGLLETLAQQQCNLSISFQGLKEVSCKQAENSRESIKVLKDNINLINKVSKQNAETNKKLRKVDEQNITLTEKIEYSVEQMEFNNKNIIETVTEMISRNTEDSSELKETIIMDVNEIKENLIKENQNLLNSKTEEFNNHNKEREKIIKELYANSEEKYLEIDKKINKHGNRITNLEDDNNTLNKFFTKMKGVFHND